MSTRKRRRREWGRVLSDRVVGVFMEKSEDSVFSDAFVSVFVPI